MSMCSKNRCEIYRDKRYCRTVTQKLGLDGECDCKHARYACQVGELCSLKEDGICEGPVDLEGGA